MIKQVISEITSITNLASTAALIVVENKTLNVSNLGKETDLNTKISEIEKNVPDHVYDKYITTTEFNKLTAEHFSARLTQGKLAGKNDISNFVGNTDFDDKFKKWN